MKRALGPVDKAAATRKRSLSLGAIQVEARSDCIPVIDIMNHAARKSIFQEIEKSRKTRVLALVTSERPGFETQIAADAVPSFVSVLDKIGPTPRLSLIIDTNGGQTSAAWRLVNLIRSFCDQLEVIVPTKAMSAGTLMALGADTIVMTKQAVLGPIDPSLDNHPLAPTTVKNGQTVRVAVSAKAVRGYIDEVIKDITDPAALGAVWTHLATQIHPILLGDIFRLGAQIRFLASDLIKRQVQDDEKQKSIIQLLCSDSGSHDYTINRRQAADMGLAIEKASEPLYRLLSSINNSYAEELETFVPFVQPTVTAANPAASFSAVRGLVESVDECHGYVTEGAGTPTASLTHGWRKLV